MLGSLVGQTRVADLLRRLVSTERVPHAVLFCGPEGSGKTAAAVSLARALQCTGDVDSAPCESCDNCNRTRMMSHPDFALLMPFLKKVGEEERRRHLIDAVSNPYGYDLPEESANTAIDEIREVIKSFSYGSFQGSWRTAVILHAHKMLPAAANAMLKTLEEPPDRSILILTAPTLDALLPTIVSRCQYYRLTPVPAAVLGTHLQEQRGTSAENAQYIAELSGGNVRLALTIASDEAHQTQERALRFLNALVTGREAQTYAALEKLVAEKADVFDVLKSAEVWLRDVLRFRMSGEDHIVNRHRLSDVEKLAGEVTDDTVLVLAEQIERVRDMNRRNVNLQLSLVELWRQARSTAPVGSL